MFLFVLSSCWILSLVKEGGARARTLVLKMFSSGASWTLFASLPSPRENREFVTRGWSGSEFSILRDCVILECLGGFLFPSPRENREFMEERAGSSEFSILRDCVFKSTLGASSFSLRESRIRG